VNKKIKSNRYKPETSEAAALYSGANIDFCLKCIITVASISVLSLCSIFAYDFITQSSFFNIKQIHISGAERVLNDEILSLADLTQEENIFGINLYSIERRIASHPWIDSASVHRSLFISTLSISIVEQKPLAIVKIENLADILINTQGRPFKEYDPLEDHGENLPVISGLDLTQNDNQYMFDGPLFNSIMNFLHTENPNRFKTIKADKNTGISIQAGDIYNRMPDPENGFVLLKLGFDNFDAKLKKAKMISEYIDKHFPDRTIRGIDLFNIQKVFIKTKLADALHTNLEKGV
jgi:cell division protein FtsQ